MLSFTKLSLSAFLVTDLAKDYENIFLIEINKWDGGLESELLCWITPVPNNLNRSKFKSDDELLELLGLSNLSCYYGHPYTVLIINIRLIEIGSPRLGKVFGLNRVTAIGGNIFVSCKTVIKMKEEKVVALNNIFLLSHNCINANKLDDFSINWVRETSINVIMAKTLNDSEYILWKGLSMSDWPWEDYIKIPREKTIGVIRTVYLIRSY